VRFGLIGFEPEGAARLVHALGHVQAFVRIVAASDVRPGSFLLRRFDVLVLALSPALEGTGWHGEQIAASNDRPLILVGSPADILAVRPELAEQVRDFLTTPLREDEFLLRLPRDRRGGRRSRHHGRRAGGARARSGRRRLPPDETAGRVLVADDDATVVALSPRRCDYGIECLVAPTARRRSRWRAKPSPMPSCSI
jgi:hypothetical protein